MGSQQDEGANSVMRGCVHARRTLKGLVVDLRIYKSQFTSVETYSLYMIGNAEKSSSAEDVSSISLFLTKVLDLASLSTSPSPCIRSFGLAS